MSGQRGRGGQCPPARVWNVSGGWAGGGASCGPGAGGGAGFRGGRPGHKAPGWGGSSAVLQHIPAQHSVLLPGQQAGDGRARLEQCALKCPPNSTCAFEPLQLDAPTLSFCLCSNGRRTEPEGECGPTSALDWLLPGLADLLGLRPGALVVILVVLGLLLLLAGELLFEIWHMMVRSLLLELQCWPYL